MTTGPLGAAAARASGGGSCEEECGGGEEGAGGGGESGEGGGGAQDDEGGGVWPGPVLGQARPLPALPVGRRRRAGWRSLRRHWTSTTLPHLPPTLKGGRGRGRKGEVNEELLQLAWTCPCR